MLELDDFELRIVGLQQAQVFHIGTAPGVDALVVVTNHKNIGFIPVIDQQLHQPVLCAAGILEFVDKERFTIDGKKRKVDLPLAKPPLDPFINAGISRMVNADAIPLKNEPKE